jgi:hypothetical protein
MLNTWGVLWILIWRRKMIKRCQVGSSEISTGTGLKLTNFFFFNKQLNSDTGIYLLEYRYRKCIN